MQRKVALFLLLVLFLSITLPTTISATSIEKEKRELLTTLGFDHKLSTAVEQEIFDTYKDVFDYKNARSGSLQTIYYEVKLKNQEEMIKNVNATPITEWRQVSEEEALISARDYDPGRPYNWIKFTMQSTISGDKVIYKTFFQWLKQPHYKMEDAMAIGVSNNLTISRDHTMLVYSRLENYGGGTEWYPLEDTYKAPHIDAGGHSIKFKLVKGPNRDINHLQGYMTVLAEKRVPSAPYQSYEAFGAYVHQELGFTIGISIPLGGSISVNGTHDKATATVKDDF